MAFKTKGTIITLVLSDVLGDSLENIASGPTIADPTTSQDVSCIFYKYDLWEKLPKRVVNLVKRGLEEKEMETPKFIPPRHYAKIICF